MVNSKEKEGEISRETVKEREREVKVDEREGQRYTR